MHYPAFPLEGFELSLTMLTVIVDCSPFEQSIPILKNIQCIFIDM